MEKPYVIHVMRAFHCDTHKEFRYKTFFEVLLNYPSIYARYPSARATGYDVTVLNSDRCDEGSNGLTDDESEALECTPNHVHYLSFDVLDANQEPIAVRVDWETTLRIYQNVLLAGKAAIDIKLRQWLCGPVVPNTIGYEK